MFLLFSASADPSSFLTSSLVMNLSNVHSALVPGAIILTEDRSTFRPWQTHVGMVVTKEHGLPHVCANDASVNGTKAYHAARCVVLRKVVNDIERELRGAPGT